MENVELRDVVRAAMRVTRADMGTLQLVSGGVLRLAASERFKSDFLDFFDSVRGDDCACGTALLENKPVVVDDIRTSPIFAGKPSFDVMRDAGSLSVVSMPLTARDGRLLGMISPHWRSAGTPEPESLKRLSWLASEAAALIEGTASGLAVRAIGTLARSVEL